MLATATVARAATAPLLRALLRDAQVVVLAEVSGVTPYDNGRVVVAALHVIQPLKGPSEAGASLEVVEMRESPLPPVFEAGRQVVAFLQPARGNTYLATHLPQGRYLAVVDRKPACLSADSPADAAATAKLIERVVSMSAQPERDAKRRETQWRAIAFDLIAARQAALVADGVASLKGLRNLPGTLSPDEQGRLEEALARDDLPAYVRLALIRTVADAGLTQLVPALRRVQSPELLAASWEALSKLQSAPPRENVEERLASTEPRVRTAAVQQLLRQAKGAAIPRVVQVATTDPDANVRVAATEALGDAGGPDAVAALETIYQQPGWETRQAVARSLRQIGGREAAEAFERMAFTAPPDAQRYAVMLLLLSGVERQDELVQRVIKTHPDPEIRRLAEVGLEVHEH